MTVLTSIPNGALLQDARHTVNAALADIAALKAGGTPTPTLSLSSAVMLPEGNSGTTAFIWTLTLTRFGSTASIPFYHAVTGNGANPANAADFGGTLPAGSGTFAPGETTKTITILVTGDTAVEPAETFLLTVTAPNLASVTSIGTISTDDAIPGFTNFVIEGDSLTSNSPRQTDGQRLDYWSYVYKEQFCPVPATVSAQGSRFTGDQANMDDGSNTLFGHLTEDATTYGGQLVWTCPFGTNDLASGGSAASRVSVYKTRLAAYKTQANAKGMKVAWGPPPSMGSNKKYNDAVPGGYENFMAARDLFIADIRDPAVHSSLCDYFVPSGLNPEINAADNTAYIGNDGVHFLAAGRDVFLEKNRAAADTILDATRSTSPSMASAAWLGGETNLAASTQITRRFVVKGIHHNGLALGASVTGGGNPQIRLNGGAWASSIGTGNGNGYRIFNGDTIDLQLTTSANPATDTAVNLTVGSETRSLTYRTVASVTPVAYQHGDVEGSTQTGQAHTYAARVFAATGLALIGVNWNGSVTGVSVGGVTATRYVHQIGGYGAVMLDAWVVPVQAGARDIVLTSTGPGAGSDTSSVISWGVVTNADSTPLTPVAANDAGTTDLATPAITVPASGIAIGLFGEYAGGSTVTPAAVSASNAGTTAIDEGQTAYQGETKGIAVAKRSANGTFSWDFAGGGYGPHPRAALAFKAAGT